MPLLSGKVAVVTGASRGTGQAIALAYAAEGADVVLAGRSERELESVTVQVRALGARGEFILADMRNTDQVVALIQKSIVRFGRIDILVNNAGGAGAYVEGGGLGLLETETTAWDELFALNLRGPFIAAREAARSMVSQGAGSIINIGSIHGQFTRWSYHGYSAAKAALTELTRMWAVELGQHGVRVNEIAPGIIAAGRNGGRLLTSAEARASREALVPLGRLGVPEDVAKIAVFLASDQAAYVSGATIVASGGWRGDMAPAPR